MSVEMITTLVGVVSLLLALAGGFGWMIHRMDGLAKDFGARIDRVDARIDRVDARIDRVGDELVEVKVAIARIEGTPRHLVTAR